MKRQRWCWCFSAPSMRAMCSWMRAVTILLLPCLHSLHITPGSGAPARKLAKDVELPHFFPIEHQELLDEAMIEILRLPDVSSGTCRTHNSRI